MGCGSANFPGCCGCTSTLLTFGDCFGEADDTICVEERLGSRRLAEESFVLLAFVSVPFPVFLSSATKSTPQLLFRKILHQRECRNMSNRSHSYVLSFFTWLHWEDHRIEAGAYLGRAKRPPTTFRTIEKTLFVTKAKGEGLFCLLSEWSLEDKFVPSLSLLLATSDNKIEGRGDTP